MSVKARPILAGKWDGKLLPHGASEDEMVGVWVGDGLDFLDLQLPWTERWQLRTMLEKGVHPVTNEPVGEPFAPGQVVAWDLDFVANEEAYSAAGYPGATRNDVREAIVGAPGKRAGCQSTEAVSAVGSTGSGLVGVLLARPKPRPKGRVHDHVVVWAWAFAGACGGQATALTPEAMGKAVDDIEGAFDVYLYHEAIRDELYDMEVY